MLIGKAEIEQMIPHGRQMCLLDEVIKWNQHKITCDTRSHRNPSNPLMKHGQLGGMMLVEYGAQAAAIHVALLQKGFSSPQPAYLGAIKQLALYTRFIDKIEDSLTVEADCLWHNMKGAIYSVQVKAADQLLITVRISLLQAGEEVVG